MESKYSLKRRGWSVALISNEAGRVQEARADLEAAGHTVRLFDMKKGGKAVAYRPKESES